MKYFLLSIFVLSSLTAGDGSFFVSPSGNDGNPGTFDLPWKTIQKAAGSVSAGSTVFVRAGTYNESVTFTVSGSEANGYITFRNYENEIPVIDGTGLTVPAGETGLIVLSNRSYVVIRGFEIRNFRTSVKNNVPVGIRLYGTSHHIRLENNTIHHIEHNGTSSSGTDAHGISVHGTSGTQSVNHIVIDGNELYALKLGSSESLVLNGNVEQFQVTNNSIHDNNNIGIDAIGFEGTAPSNDQARDGIIAGNRVYNIDSFGNPAYGTDRSADGIYVDGGKNIVIERNIVHHCNIGIELASEHSGKSTSGITVRNNIIYFSDNAGIAIGGYDTNRGSTVNCRILNNTLFQNDKRNNGSGEFYIQFDTKNNQFKNNILTATSQNIFISNEYTANTGNEVDYNLYFSPGGATASSWMWKNIDYTTFAAYKSATGNDAHSLFADPKFISVLTPDLHLSAGSPAINSGIAADSAGLLDVDGNPRLNGTIDIGADEYGSVSPNGVRETQMNVEYHELMQNYPNPFNPSTSIRFSSPISGRIVIRVFNVLGVSVATLFDDVVLGGEYHTVMFNGVHHASGTYFIQYRSGSIVLTKRMLLIK